MPYPFVLPTTSSFSFSSSFTCDSHPSLPLQASTHRGVVRDTLKKHKRLPPASQAPNLPNVISALQTYIPYLLTVETGLSGNNNTDAASVTVAQTSQPQIEWRPTLASNLFPGLDPPRVKISSLHHEVLFTLSCLANTHTLLARSTLQPLYLTNTAPVGTTARQTAITTATRHLLDAASIYDYLTTRSPSPSSSSGSPPPLPCLDLSPATLSAQRSLALAEATLLAVLKDDPYPAIANQLRNKHDTEWMYKAPDVPRVRAHLFARLCLAAGEHAAQAAALLASAGGNSSSGGGSSAAELVKYANDLRRASRARACRFFGVDAELGGETGTGIAWLRAGLKELGVESGTSGSDGKTGKLSGLKGLKKEWSERREDKKVERGLDWGADGGRLEETRVIEMLEAKWVKQNDTILTQPIPPIGPLLAQMPTGREIHTIKPYQPPVLEPDVLEAMRAAPPNQLEEGGAGGSSDEDTAVGSSAPGGFSGRSGEYRTDSPGYY